MAGLSPAEIQYEEAHINDNLGPAIIAANVILITIATVAVALRLICRLGRKVVLGADDYFACAALFFAWGCFIADVMSAKFGLGKHLVAVGLPNTEKILKAQFALELVYCLCTLCIKMSFLTLFRRVFGTHNTAFKIALYFVMAYSVCWFISIFFVAIFQCVPPDHAWNLQPGGKCLNLHAALLGTAAANTLGDIMILILPMPMLVKLNMPKKQKFGVVGVFAVGFFVVIASGIRLDFLNKTAVSGDITWDNFHSSLWTTVEACIGITCSCLPIMRPLFSGRRLDRFLSYKSYSSGQSKNRTASTWPSKRRTKKSPEDTNYSVMEDVPEEPGKLTLRGDERSDTGLVNSAYRGDLEKGQPETLPMNQIHIQSSLQTSSNGQ